MTQLELLTTEESLITIEASVAASDAALIQDQIALFKALGGGLSVREVVADSREVLISVAPFKALQICFCQNN